MLQYRLNKIRKKILKKKFSLCKKFIVVSAVFLIFPSFFSLFFISKNLNLTFFFFGGTSEIESFVEVW